MYRRRRPPTGEIAFSFDSFLDLVANVVGVILRLILVAWLGARAYTGVFHPLGATSTSEADSSTSEGLPAEPKYTTDAEKTAVEQAKKQLADARAALLEHLRQQQDVQSRRKVLDRQIADLKSKQSELTQAFGKLDERKRAFDRAQATAGLSLAEIRERSEKISKELETLAKQPVVKQVLRYQTPVARTVQSEEMHFEIKDGRVTFLDVEALVREITQGLQGKGEQLRTSFQLNEETGPVGAFKLRYVISRERGLMDSVAGGSTPVERDGFRFGIESWEAVPIKTDRGETADQALAAGSEFRRLIDHLDAMQTAVTFWVYPESFGLYRQLRDYCVRRDLLVAGRPLVEGVPIASSRQGTASRGQ
jgi:hypothetical protein